MKALFEFRGDVWAAEAIAGVVVWPDEDDDELWYVSIVPRNTDKWLDYPIGSESDARKAQLDAVAAWKRALAQGAA